jgi:two-component system, NtrC family, response regulator AtoC
MQEISHRREDGSPEPISSTPLYTRQHMGKATILVVDDEQLIRWSLVERLSQDGYKTLEADTGASAQAQFGEEVDLVLLDYRLPDTNGLDLMKDMLRREPDVLVILITAFSNVASAVEIMKAGAYHYATKPFNLDEIAVLVEKALETTRLRREVRALRANQAKPWSIDKIVGTSSAMQQMKELLTKIAASPASTVLLTGESGTGKDLAAKVIHYASSRAAQPFMNITCSALTDSLLESELFGHERGAFTDARQQKRGLLESADGGSVFLDEIGEMAPGLQSKLLRFLEEKTFKRVGGAQDIKVDVRIIAATNRDLEQSVKQGEFREDLYYRLDVLPVRLPPLRERATDIPALAKYYIDLFNREFRKQVQGAAPDVFEAIERYPWPGNVRELRNAIERAMLLTDADMLQLSDFPMIGSRPAASAGMELAAGGTNLEQLERGLVVQALERTQWNQTQAAALLGLNRDQIRYRIEKFGLSRS